MDCDIAGYKQARCEEVSNELKSMLVKDGWKKDMADEIVAEVAACERIQVDKSIDHLRINSLSDAPVSTLLRSTLICGPGEIQGQTRQHSHLMNLLDVKRIVCGRNKMSRPGTRRSPTR